MRNNVVQPANEFIARYGEHAYSKAREAQGAARKQGKGKLAAFYAKIAERIAEVSARRASCSTERLTKTRPRPSETRGAVSD
jgi:hypothetical protein